MSPPALIQSPSDLPNLLNAVEERPGAWFAILDACDEPQIPAFCRAIGKDAVSLYRGSAERDLWAVAPYLVQLDVARLKWIVDSLDEPTWGILIQAEQSLESIRRHLRKFLMVDGPEGRRLYFRFYDPRVLPTFLVSSETETLNEFFGPCAAFVCPNLHGEFDRFEHSADGMSGDKASGESTSQRLELDSFAFAQRLTRRIGTALERTGRAIPPQMLTNQIAQGMMRAKSYGMSDAADVGGYVETICCYLGGFGNRPDPIPVQNCLRDTTKPMAERVKRLSNLVREITQNR